MLPQAATLEVGLLCASGCMTAITQPCAILRLAEATVVRRAILTETEKTSDLMPKMVKGDGTLVVGPGPSLQELDARIKKLEDAVSKLQGK
jgi:hypothetical protein